MHGHSTTPTTGANTYVYPTQSFQPSNHTSVSEINSVILSHTLHSNQGFGPGSHQGAESGFMSQTGPFTSSGIASGSGPAGKGKGTELLKTPVSLLNEVCAKANVTPQFQTTDHGPPHERVFECTVTLQTQGLTLEGIGKARSKKDAKQEAAKALLLSMDDKVEKFLVPSKSPTDEVNEPDCDPDVEGNPVGELNDMCLKMKRVPPEYVDVETEGKPHERVHVVACKLGDQLVEQGRGRTKKHAKKVAANKVKQRLTELMLTSVGVQEEKHDGCIIDKLHAMLDTNQSAKTKDDFNLERWLTEFRERSGAKLKSLQDSSRISGSDPTTRIMEICEEQKFKVEYLDIDKPASGDGSEEMASIVSIGIEPIAIFLGTGANKTQSRKSAALKAIEFLKIATRN